MIALDTTASWRRFGVATALLIGLAGASACFTDSLLPMEAEDTGGPACTPGDVGCACTDGATCASALTCLVRENVCIPTGCAPGSAFCTCNEGACDGELSCTQGVCVPGSADDGVVDDASSADATSATSASVDGTADAGTTGGGSTDDGVSTDGDGTGAGTTDTTTGTDDGDTGSDTGPSPECLDAATCAACFDCVTEADEPCAAKLATCQGIAGCTTVAACLRGCSASGLCLDDCCSGHSNAAVDAGYEVDECRRGACAGGVCSDYNDAQCF